jgi:uncharacterized membrane protein
MVLYHFSFDLDNFNYIQIDMDHSLFWQSFRSIIVTLFLTTMGISLALTHSKNNKKDICWPCMKKRTLYLGVASILVSVGSYIEFPDTWIYFGILHFILFASWLGLLFVGRPWISLITAIIILIGSYFGWLHTHALFDLVHQPLHLPVHYTEDMVNIFPWFAPVLMGIYITAKGWHLIPHLKPSFISTKLAFMGRHSLIIYLIHQPILFGATLLFYKLNS